MSGGAWEYVAAYIDNGNMYWNIGGYGISTYFASGKIKHEYAKYYDVYEPGDDEKQGAPNSYYGPAISDLWSEVGYSQPSNAIRKALTDATYSKMANKKGDAMWESSREVSYLGKDSDGNYSWLTNTNDTAWNPSKGWDDDFLVYGHGFIPWISRGGTFNNGGSAGVFAARFESGSGYVEYGFRPVLVADSTL